MVLSDTGSTHPVLWQRLFSKDLPGCKLSGNSLGSQVSSFRCLEDSPFSIAGKYFKSNLKHCAQFENWVYCNKSIGALLVSHSSHFSQSLKDWFPFRLTKKRLASHRLSKIGWCWWMVEGVLGHVGTHTKAVFFCFSHVERPNSHPRKKLWSVGICRNVGALRGTVLPPSSRTSSSARRNYWTRSVAAPGTCTLR